MFGDGFVLIRFNSPEVNVEALFAAASNRSLPLEIIDIDHVEAAAIYEKPLVLVRPDGHIAWRGEVPPDDPVALIDLVRGI